MNDQNQLTKSVSIIGLGAMGTAIAKSHLEKGYRVTVWNRSLEKMKVLEAEGALSAESIENAVSGNKVIIICLLDYEVVRALLTPLKDLLAGKIIINLTNGTPMQADEIAEFLLLHNAQYLDGGIMAVPPMIGQKHALLLLSGSESAWKDSRELLEVLGTVNYLGPKPALAALFDLALLTAMYGMFSGYLQALALAASSGIKAVDFTPMVTGWLQAMIPSCLKMAVDIDAENHTSDVVSRLDMQIKALVNLNDTYKNLGISVSLISPLKEIMEKTVAQGYGYANLSAIFNLIKGG